MPYLFDVNRCILSVMEPLIRDMKASTIGHKGLGLNEKLEFAKFLTGKSKLCLSTFTNFNSASIPLLYRKSQFSYYKKMTEKCMDEFNKLLDENTVLLMPTLPVAAPYHSETIPLQLSVCYMSLFNVLGLPATHCPLGFTRKGLPYGIQIVGCQNNDPLTIACAVELEKAFGGWKSC
ncbi:Fatty-acid amide hydrolase 2 [Araneus ventricosus]|uniref:Fatty-acid amide hydrolase 2 n=1 Tax=Araneus ventricosus TaxID=182803 RepID=A0A4Y2KCG4_ARAVE|nr:Fatty-acid amide hydrolase 2 [Araneus ventricosus]GBM99967.1 Fatty-acid amide hydrolase 2 [Araneus ventricosus]GBN00024.1 Fatty-acid amide hydrolase 2 [Araneus ventricosus]GBN00050.1 Fatty-acid amide hydrolase 2 [Araneus ventricosus]